MKKEDGKKQYWSAAEGAFCCLIDKKRTSFFKRAIKDTVKEGDIVVDAGTGTGILALFALNSGARKVYVIEEDERSIETLKENFSVNGYESEVEIIKGDARKVILPQKVDVIICEMIATGLIEELQVPVMDNMLNFGKKNVKVLLNRYDSFVDLVYNNANFYGYELNIYRYEYLDIKETISNPFSRANKYLSLDFSKKNGVKNVNKKIRLNVYKNGKINGIRISGHTFFHGNSHFNYSSAYSFPLILPVGEISVKKGERFELELSYRVCGGMGDVKYSLNKII